MSVLGTLLTIDIGQSMSALPPSSDIDLLGYGECIINFDTAIGNRSFNFGMAQKQLDGSEIACSAINERRLGSAQGMSTKEGRVKPNSATHWDTNLAYWRVDIHFLELRRLVNRKSPSLLPASWM